MTNSYSTTRRKSGRTSSLPHALAGLTALLTGAFSVLVSYFRLLLMSVPDLSAKRRVPASTYLGGFPVLYRLVTCSFFWFSERAHGLILCPPKTPSDSSRAWFRPNVTMLLGFGVRVARSEASPGSPRSSITSNGRVIRKQSPATTAACRMLEALVF